METRLERRGHRRAGAARPGLVPARGNGAPDRDRQDRPLRILLLVRRDPGRPLLGHACGCGEASRTGRNATASCSARDTRPWRSTRCWPVSTSSQPSSWIRTPASAARSATTPTCAASPASTSAPARSAMRSRPASAWRWRPRAAPRPPRLRAAGRRRAARGPGVGGGDGGRAPSGGEPDRDRRPQRLLPGRTRRRRDRHRAAGREVVGVRLVGGRGRRTRRGALASAFRRLASEQRRLPGGGDRAHRQGQGRRLHGARARVASGLSRPGGRAAGAR